MKVKRTKTFLKAFKKCPKVVQQKIIERLDLFLTDPQHPFLNVHSLHGEFKGISSFNVTGDYRVWYAKEVNSGEIILLLLNVGSHAQLY